MEHTNEILDLPSPSRSALAVRVRELRKTLNRLEGSLQVDAKGIGHYDFGCVSALFSSATAEWGAVCALAAGGEINTGLFGEEEE